MYKKHEMCMTKIRLNTNIDMGITPESYRETNKINMNK